MESHHVNDPMFQEASVTNVVNMETEEAVQLLVRHAADLQSSDLFFHSNEKSVEIAVRRLGKVQRLASVSLEQGKHLIGHIKAMA